MNKLNALIYINNFELIYYSITYENVNDSK